MTRSVVKTALFLAVALFCAQAFASSGELMNFQGLGNQQVVGSFYDGGGLASTPNYGITFSSNFYSLISTTYGGGGSYAGTPLGTPAIFINGTTGSPALGVINVSPGFSNGINFFFSAAFTGHQLGTVTIWSGANGTGTVLATITLANNNGICSSPTFCTWTDVGASFSGVAHSVTFSGPANELGLTDITVGSSSTAIPEPSSFYLLGTGFLGFGIGKVRRFLGV
jgi:hypothetical protein